MNVSAGAIACPVQIVYRAVVLQAVVLQAVVLNAAITNIVALAESVLLRPNRQ